MHAKISRERIRELNPKLGRKLDLQDETSKLIGVALTHDPTDLASVGNKFLAFNSTLEIRKTISNTFRSRFDREPSDDAKALLFHGINDVHDIVKHSIQHYNSGHAERLAIDTALAAMHHHRTIATVALIAARNQEDKTALIYNGVGRFYWFDTEHPAINYGPSLYPSASRDGCPVATTEIRGPLPVFRAFVPWAGALAIHRMANDIHTFASEQRAPLVQ